MNLKELLLERRKSLQLSLVNISALTGIDQALLSKYETGNRLPSETHLKLLSETLKFEYTQLRAHFIAEKIYQLLEHEVGALEALKIAESRVEYLSSSQVFKIQDINNSVKEKLKIADDLRNKWQQNKPLNKSQLQKLKEYFTIKYTFDSNRIEGNTLTYQETQLIINEGVTIGGKTMREHLEAINHSEAVDFITDMLLGKEDVTKRNLLDIHRLVLKSIDNENAGKFRNVKVRISGSEHIPPDAIVVTDLMESYITHYNMQKKILHPILLAAEMHERLATIHPFIDGNGRTSRLIMNFILLHHGYTIAILKGDTQSKITYFKALEQVQIHNDPNPFYELITDRVIESLKEHLELI